MRAAINTF